MTGLGDAGRLLGDAGGVEVDLETVPQRLRGVCWTGGNLEAVRALAGDGWIGMTRSGHPQVRTAGGTEPVLGIGWWVVRDAGGGLIVSAGYAAGSMYRLAGESTADETGHCICSAESDPVMGEVLVSAAGACPAHPPNWDSRAGAPANRLDGPHPYTSTACWHADRDGRPELHGYCQNVDGQAGPKVPARCKWCPSPCTCVCHEPGDAL